MAQRYSDIIRLRESKPAYNIEHEETGEWNAFIANEQFNEVLEKVISSVRNDNMDTHKSFWISGTYGTGKSHAGAVIMHLLCDDVEKIREWIDAEYADKKYEQLRSDLYNLRKSKCLLPVKMYGQSNISHRDDLSLQIQKAVKQALKEHEIDLKVKTDFDNYAEHIENNSEIWNILIHKNSQLRAIAPDRQKLISNMRNQDSNTLHSAEMAMRENGLNVQLDSAKLKDWFFEIQDCLRKTTDNKYNGLFVIWDEFTEVMKSDIGKSLLVALQEVNEAVTSTKNDSYFLFISHPSALTSLEAEEREKTKGRYHYMTYNMKPVSAFRIMSAKFVKAVDTEIDYYNMTHNFFASNSDLYDIYSADSTSPEETCEDIKKLYPVHPSTANLATYYASVVGSSSRSVFEFLGDNQAIRDFLNSEEQYAARNTITADYLWDYVLSVFEANVQQYGSVTERFNSYRKHVENKGSDYLAVFKSILLLNALNNIAGNDNVTPSEENIRHLFKGTAIERKLQEILEWINTEGIIQRNPSMLYSVQFSALPVIEISKIKEKLMNSEFRFTSQVINFGDAAKKEQFNTFTQVMRPHQYSFYGIENNVYTLQNKIENGRKKCHDYELFFAILVARNDEELSQLEKIAEMTAVEERFENTVILLFKNVLGNNNYDRFIEYMANAQCAQQHGFAEQQKADSRNAEEMIVEWTRRIKQGNVAIYLRSIRETVGASRLVPIINKTISYEIFSSGAEALEPIRSKSASTYWKKLLAKDAVKNVLMSNTKQDICDHCKGPAMLVNYLLQDSVDENLEWKPDIDCNHPLKKVCDFVDKKIRDAQKTVSFNLAERLIDLTKPPYGLYQTYSGMGMLAFAMKKYVGKVFDINGKPLNALHIVEIVVETFKCWESGNESKKTILKFETPEENRLCKSFIDLFNLRKMEGYHDISSLTDARRVVKNKFVKAMGFPLWSLKYADVGDGSSWEQERMSQEELNKAIDNIVRICNETGTQNPAMMGETIDLLKKWKYELPRIVNNADYYKNGFIAFLKSEKVVKLRDEETEDASNDIRRRYLQKEVGTWSEEEVINALKDWRIDHPIVSESTEPEIINKLYKCFIDLFNLRNMKEYSDISSLKNAQWTISHEFVNEKGYPLWSLKYSLPKTNPQVVSQGIPKEDFNQLIDNIVKICKEVWTSNPSMMTDTIKLIDQWKHELRLIVNNGDNYRDGFFSFLKSEEVVKLRDEETEDASNYIRCHSQKEVGTWSEEEVITALKDWRIKHPIVSEPTDPGIINKQRRAKEWLNSMKEDEMRKVLNSIIDLGNERICDIILKS